MQYLGGKHRLAKHLVRAIREQGVSGPFWDPFCGGLSMSVALTREFGGGLVSDLCKPLISLYTAVRSGWSPPTTITPQEYKAARELPDTDPLKAFAGFGVSFGGKWFGGLAKPDGKNDYCRAAKNALIRDCAIVDPFVCDFLSSEPVPGLGFLYLDPPYAGTTGYAGVSDFDTSLFRRRAAQWAEMCPVFISEYECPIGRCIWSGPGPSTGTLAGACVERLFKL
jgi:DNA adenine methylase